MNIPAASDTVLEFVHCKCTLGCENRRCSSIIASLKCLDLCKCADSQNNGESQENSNEINDLDSDTLDSCDDFSSEKYSEDEQ